VSGIKEPHPFLFIRKNGSKVLTRIATTPLYDEAGNFNGAIGILSDITRQNETEKALRENQALLNEMGKMVKVGGWELDADTLHVRWTEEIYRIHELPPGSTPPLEEAINYFHPEEREKLSDSVQRAFKYGEAYDMELRFITARGKHLWTRTICIPEVVDGKTVRLKGTLQDITKHKQVEEALLQEQQFSKLVLDNLPGIFYLYTYPERRLVLWNKQHETLLGYTAEELKDRFATDWYPPKGKDAVLKATEEVMEKGHSSAESFLLAKDGHRIPFFLTGIRFEAQGRLYYMGIGTDITDRKLAEEKIKASLLEKETMLKEIHHRVKNNLQVISSLLDLQSSYLQDEKVREIFQSSRNRVNAMANIHTLLYQSEDLARIDFGAFIRDLTGRLQQSYGIAESPAEIHVNVSDVSLTIETSVPCGLILNELVTNALKHAFPQGREGKVNISMKAEGDQFTLTVSDNGIGFPEAVDFQNTKSLGLELVNLLVGQMNGAIDLTVEGGTTFTITFSTVSNGGSAHGKEKDHDC
jgi:PAS domain S-box-containing protein